MRSCCARWWDLRRSAWMELEVKNLTGAARGERSSARLNQRNDYRDRDWETRVGTFELRIPKQLLPCHRSLVWTASNRVSGQALSTVAQCIS